MLPADRYLAELLGLTEEQYEHWREEVQSRAQQAPRPANIPDVRAGIDPVSILVTVAISVGLQLIGMLLMPTPNASRPAQLKSRTRAGESQNSVQAFAPRVGFDAVQQVASLGEPIPVVYANRETINGVTYGGVRVNATLLWSQIWSLGGSQMLRAVFMVAEGKVASIDPQGFAIGDNSIGVYDLGTSQANEIGSRITVYYRDNGGRITSANRITGRLASADAGNAENNGGADVFYLQSVNNAWSPDFSAAIKPSTSTTFGVYSPIGNNLGFKLNPVVRPGVTARLKPKGKEGDARVACDKDEVVQAQRAKYAAFFSSRSGITANSAGPVSYSIGDTITYKLLRSSDYDTEFSDTSPVVDEWTVTAEVERFDNIYPRGVLVGGASNFGPKLSVTLSQLLSALAFGPTVVNTQDKTVSANVSVNLTTIESVVTNTDDGTASIEYWIVAKNSSRDLEIRSKYNLKITTRSVPSYLATSESSEFSREYSLSQSKNPDGLVTNVTLDASGNKSITVTTALSLSLFTQRDYDLEVAEESGLVEAVSNPPRLRSNIVFNYEDPDAYSEKADDAASSITGRQRAWDDAIVPGELYKIGSALAVCTGRSPDNEIFRSDSELQQPSSGQSITATFRVVRAGQAEVATESLLEQDGTTAATRETGTSGAHIMRVAVANLTTSRECKVIELGFRSRLGISINGLLRFRSTLSFAQTDGRACLNKEGDLIKRGNTVKVDQYQSGTVVTAEERYSFFRVSYREYSETSFTNLSQCFGAVGLTQQSIFNYLRLEMPSVSRWEIRIEPLTGWEIRESIATGDLCVLDSSLSSSLTVSTVTGGRTVRATFNGRVVTRASSTFRLRQAQRSPEMGLPHPDTDGNYADSWGKLAEAFIYDEIKPSTDQPEHEVVYVNEIVPNTVAPQYNGIALIGTNAVSAYEWRQFSQLSPYVTGGTEVRRLLNGLSEGPSHLLPDLALDRLTNPKYGPGRITDDLINLSSFQAAAQWCQNRRYFFDGGVIINEEPARQWIADKAGAMLLDFREVGGRYELVPFIPDPSGNGSTFGQVTHKALFTAGNIEEGSFQYESISPDDRQPIQVSVKWREERSSVNPANPGLFPVEREVLVREAAPNGSDTHRIEPTDVSEFCTNENHAIDVAKFTIRMRRLRDHTIRFRTTYDGLEGITTGVGPGDFIRVAMDTTAYDQFNNGVVLGDGTIVSTQPLADGVFSVISWDGNGSVDENATLTVSGGKATPAGVIFTVKQIATQVRTYQISKITPSDDGKYDIEAVHMPTDSNGRLLVAADWDSASAWVITR